MANMMITGTQIAREQERAYLEIEMIRRRWLEHFADPPWAPAQAPLPRFKNLPAPGKYAVAVAETVDQEYIALAKELGISNDAMLKTQLEQFLAEEHIDVYLMQAVHAYMDDLVAKEQKQGLTWGWRPLRPFDKSDNIPYRLSGTYAKPVPYPVLLTVKRITDVFGKALSFFVSDYEVVKPDPFLMVTAQGLPQYVIERWDEPKFRG